MRGPKRIKSVKLWEPSKRDKRKEIDENDVHKRSSSETRFQVNKSNVVQLTFPNMAVDGKVKVYLRILLWEYDCHKFF